MRPSMRNLVLALLALTGTACGGGGSGGAPAPAPTPTPPANGAPSFTSSAQVATPDGSTDTGYTATADDPDGDALAFALSGGEDAARFAIDPLTGELRFLAASDEAAPSDADADNVYLVTVSVADGNGGSASQDVRITVDGTAPTVLAVDPPATAVGVLVAAPVTATLSESVDDATVTVQSFTLTGPAGPVPGTVDRDGAVLRFTPDAPLAFDTVYEATLTTALEDAAGNALAAARSWRFDTAPRLNAAYVGHTCARLVDGGIRCWGRNQDAWAGALGLGDTNARGDEPGEMGDALPRVDLGADRLVLAVEVGSAHGCALLDDRSVKCWGANGSGQLGLGDTERRGDEAGEMGDALPAVDLGTAGPVLELSVGNAHACVRTEDGAVRCWGDNGSGQLGLGDTEARGDEAGELGDALATVDLGTGRTARRLRSADRYTCAILDDDSVKCWGLNTDADLGLGDTENRGDDPGEMGDALPAVDLGTTETVAQIAADEHTCVRFTDGRAKCWGANNVGQLGLGDTEERGDASGEMGAALPFLDLGTGRTVRRLTTGSRHSCAILDDGSVKCWGSNSSGRLGLGDTEERGSGPGDMGDALPTVDLGSGLTARELTTGDSYTCAALSDDTVKCWGSNFFGQLGLGDEESRGDAPGEMGSALPVVDLGD